MLPIRTTQRAATEEVCRRFRVERLEVFGAAIDAAHNGVLKIAKRSDQAPAIDVVVLAFSLVRVGHGAIRNKLSIGAIAITC